jgi:hypothetical protein
MSRIRNPRLLALSMALPLFLAGVSPDSPLGLTLLQEAHAVVGAPLTPVSVAGVARRTTRRTVVAGTAAAASTATTATAPQQDTVPHPPGAPAIGTVVSALPAGCKPETRSGVEYQNCGGVYYRAAFQSNNLVYVVQ